MQMCNHNHLIFFGYISNGVTMFLCWLYFATIVNFNSVYWIITCMALLGTDLPKCNISSTRELIFAVLLFRPCFHTGTLSDVATKMAIPEYSENNVVMSPAGDQEKVRTMYYVVFTQCCILMFTLLFSSHKKKLSRCVFVWTQPKSENKFCESETIFVDPFCDSDPLLHLMGCSLAHGIPWYQVSWKLVW